MLLLYTVIPLPLYMCVLTGSVYTALFEVLTYNDRLHESPGVKFALHIAIHLLGIHIYILTQVRQRKTFIKVRHVLQLHALAGRRIAAGAQGSHE